MKIKIISLRRSHIDYVVQLESEFEDYIQSLSSLERDIFDKKAKRGQLLKYAF
jgi:hypothetical protein